MSVLGTVEQAGDTLKAADAAAGEAVSSVAATVQTVDERAGQAALSAAETAVRLDEKAGQTVLRAFEAVPRPGIIPAIGRTLEAAGLASQVTVETVARGMMFTSVWSVALMFGPLMPMLPVFAGLFTVYLYGL